MIARLTDDLSALSHDALFDRLCNLSDNQKRGKELGLIWQEYNPLIARVCEEIKARGGNVMEWLDAAETL